nr:MAG TPA: hypothetical protein [Caudoviricetes sp.]
MYLIIIKYILKTMRTPVRCRLFCCLVKISAYRAL